jgi:hypothetical protein
MAARTDNSLVAARHDRKWDKAGTAAVNQRYIRNRPSQAGGSATMSFTDVAQLHSDIGESLQDAFAKPAVGCTSQTANPRVGFGFSEPHGRPVTGTPLGRWVSAGAPT